MSWFRLLGKLSMVPLVASLILTTGCGGRRTRHDQDGGGSVPVPTSQTPGPGPVVVPAGDRTPVEVKQYTTLKGKVTFEGTPPKPSPIDTMGHKDTPYCMKGDLNDFTWRVDPNGGVANVVIWVAPAPGKYFPLPPADKKTWPDEVTVDQPFCAFEPHASVAYTQYWDGKKMVATGQKVMIV